MRKVLVDRELLERTAAHLEWDGSEPMTTIQFAHKCDALADELRRSIAQPAEAACVDFGFDDRSVRVSQEAYSIFLARERHHLAALSAVTAERDGLRELINSANGFQDALERERDQLRAEVAQLRQHKNDYMDAAEGTRKALLAEVEALRKDKERIDAIEQECWDVRFLSSPNGDAGDSSISIEIVGHFMAEPCERVVGENYNENLRAALDQAMTAEAYPPARPEYDERGRPVRAAMAAKEA